MKSIALIGQKTDPHIIGISNELKKINENYVIIDQFSSNDSFYVTYENDLSECNLRLGNLSFNKGEIKSVWNTSALKVTIDSEVVEASKKFILAEWTEGIRSLWNSIETKWVNSPESILNSSNRLSQLKIANEIGLSTPKSLITNDPKKLNDFFYSCNRNIVTKTLNSSQGLPNKKMIFTTKIGEKELVKSSDLQYAPCMFQEYIPKKTEFRITIIDKKIHTAEIHSQNSDKTKDDWRNYDDFDKTPYMKAELPKDVEEKLLKIMTELGLVFGAIDMIRTPNDDFVFLEINANGRWWWIQELTKMNIAKDIALDLSKE